MIRRLLIANRGEIVARIARTARMLGIWTVGVYAPPDRSAPWLDATDDVIGLIGDGVQETYLSVEALLRAAQRVGADALHPGYGFLSEHPGFAEAVIAAGLTWIGPPPEAIALMGDKERAKAHMARAGVPTLPTFAPDDPDVVLPVLVKPTAGGGGKGMDVVRERAALGAAIDAARRTAAGAFGDDRVFLERFVEVGRHVEIQVVADGHGAVVHCFERECSIQRRHQKVLEEAPSPVLDADLRERMGAAACAAARAVGYRGVGTVEFLLEPDGSYWFLEMNTRLQVEHPVTEAITGIDLVAEQLRIAEGRPTSLRQDGLGIDGHAIEVRLYAEDPAAGFLPQTGTLVEWAPADEPGIRWDSAVATGTTVAIEYDPLLAKVIAHAPTRDEAARLLARALRRSRIRGVTTNRAFLVALLEHPEFLAGATTTDFIERTGIAHLAAAHAPLADDALIAASLRARADDRARVELATTLPAGRRLGRLPATARTWRVGDEVRTVALTEDRAGRLWIGDRRLDRVGVEGGWVEWFEREVGCELRRRFHVLRDGDTFYVQGDGVDVRIERVDPFAGPATEPALRGGLEAPMPGRVLSVEVGVGDRVRAGALLAILEAMKMEHHVLAPHDGVIGEVRVAVGEQVDRGDVLVVLEEG